MKRIAYYAIHYGKEYLAWSVRSIRAAVDEVHFLYTPTPSYGYRSPLSCPESEEELHAEAHRFGREGLFWHRGSWATESEHRNAIYGIASSIDAAQALVVDADEVWMPGQANRALQIADAVGDTLRAGELGVPMIHFWRSFGYVCRDHWLPIRLLNFHEPTTQRAFLSGGDIDQVLHFGYAQSLALTAYKWTCHGHQNELRKGWFDKFVGWRPGIGDVHPTTIDIWNPEPYDRRRLYDVLGDHPNYTKELIQ